MGPRQTASVLANDVCNTSRHGLTRVRRSTTAAGPLRIAFIYAPDYTKGGHDESSLDL